MTTQQQTKTQPRKPYKRPKLTTFGDIRLLTQAGSAGRVENNSNSGKKKA